MVFSSLTFLFVFLPLSLFVYYLVFIPYTVTRQSVFISLANLFLFLASLVFYFWGQAWFVVLMMISAILDYVCGLIIEYARSNPKLSESASRQFAKAGLVISIVGNIGILGTFKYFNFGIDIVRDVCAGLFGTTGPFLQVAQLTLPIGISFYTFQTMSYTIDVYRGIAKANRNFVDYCCFVTMFPQLVAGPIVRYIDVAEQLRRRTVTVKSFSSGVERFTIGLGKKVLVANTMAAVVDKIFAIPQGELGMNTAWLGVVCYAIQIYFDFSGYSDMAIGLGRMLGFEFLENFNYPYIAQSVREFWRRWHISLSTWFRDYLYVPLGGNRIGRARTYLNLGMVFFLVGLWHGAAGKFVLWGLYHGVFMILERGAFGRMLSTLWGPVRHVYTLAVVLIGWVFFRADSLAAAVSFLKTMLGWSSNTGHVPFDPTYINNETWVMLLLGVIGCTPIGRIVKTLYLQCVEGVNVRCSRSMKMFASLTSVTYLIGIFVFSTMFLASGTYNPFIYFRF
jgi:alginate O-acetyltransferase complex protein AlgI